MVLFGLEQLEEDKEIKPPEVNCILIQSTLTSCLTVGKFLNFFASVSSSVKWGC